ncbi:hypothetical protein SLS60_004419 [Paraconiothyrium brasiliense]|uniref:Uncharacterized protein n=1 Tax=Paraconiothyrium brasiliense TaxID=300254 RepID=A0ABR3RKA6_9PLEO
MSTHIPIMFTLPPSNRHELILLDIEKPSLKALNKQLTATIASSPNCAEFMAKHKSQESAKEQILELRIHWSETGRDRKVWPEFTIVTEENFAAILEVLGKGDAKDVLEVKVGKDE